MMAAAGPREVRRWLSGTATWLHQVDREGQRAYCALRPWSREECGAHLGHVAMSTSWTRRNGTGAQAKPCEKPDGNKRWRLCECSQRVGMRNGQRGEEAVGPKGAGGEQQRTQSGAIHIEKK